MDSKMAIFQADHKGKCSYCGEKKRLDEMVNCLDSAGKIIKGRYEDIDCHLIHDLNNEIETYVFAIKKELLQDKKSEIGPITRAMVWLFG